MRWTSMQPRSTGILIPDSDHGAPKICSLTRILTHMDSIPARMCNSVWWEPSQELSHRPPHVVHIKHVTCPKTTQHCIHQIPDETAPKPCRARAVGSWLFSTCYNVCMASVAVSNLLLLIGNHPPPISIRCWFQLSKTRPSPMTNSTESTENDQQTLKHGNQAELLED
jgi:hypothetical protein